MVKEVLIGEGDRMESMKKNLRLIAVKLVERYSVFVGGWSFCGVHHVVI